MSGRLSGLSSCAIFLVVSGIVPAQNDISLTGTVKDAVAVPIAGASVTLISPERVRQTKSEVNGSFAFGQITADPYEVEIMALGFAKQKISLNT